MAFEGIAFPIDDYTRDLDELDRIVLFERLHVDIDTNGQNVVPKIILNNSTVTLSTINNASRAVTEVAINRIGPASEVQFAYDIDHEIQFYGLDLVIRALDLNVNIVPLGQTIGIRGRAVAPATQLLWDIPYHVMAQDVRVTNLIPRRLYVDIVTGAQNVVPHLILADGTDVTLATITHAARAKAEYSILRSDRIRQVKLVGDFTNSAVILYDLEMDVYIPAKRRMAIG